MMISYDGIVFDVVHLEKWDRVAEYSTDKTTFLWWHHSITVTCMLNEQATAASDFPPRFAVLRRGAGVGAPAQVRNQKVRDVALPKFQPPAFPANGFDKTTPVGLGLTILDAANRAYKQKKFSERNKKEADALRRKELENSAAIRGPGVGGLTQQQQEEYERIRQAEDASSSAIRVPAPRTDSLDDADEAKQRRNQILREIDDIHGNPKPGKGDDLPKQGDAGPRQAKGQNNAAGQHKAKARLVRQNVRGTVPATDQELRRRLNHPRRELLVWLYTGDNATPEFMLVSPLHPDAETDAQHGPVCTIEEVPEIHGQVSAVMRLTFETWEAPPIEHSYVDEEVLGITTKERILRALEANLKSPTSPVNDFERQTERQAANAAAKAFLDATKLGDGTPAADAQKALEAFHARIIIGGLGAGGLPGLAAAADLRAANRIAEKVIGELRDVANEAAVDKAPVFVRRQLLETPAVVSHRWTMSFGWDPETYLRLQHISGEVIFRMDVLSMRGLTADQLRQQFWHPIPAGYIRSPSGGDDIKETSDGSGIQYVITDVEQMTNMPGPARYGIIHASVEEEFEYSGYGALIDDTPAPSQKSSQPEQGFGAIIPGLGALQIGKAAAAAATAASAAAKAAAAAAASGGAKHGRVKGGGN